MLHSWFDLMLCESYCLCSAVHFVRMICAFSTRVNPDIQGRLVCHSHWNQSVERWPVDSYISTGNIKTMWLWLSQNLFSFLYRSACCGGGSRRDGSRPWHRKKLGERAGHTWNHDVSWGSNINIISLSWQSHSGSVCLSLPQRCSSLTFRLGASHGREGCRGGSAGICLLSCWRESR